MKIRLNSAFLVSIFVLCLWGCDGRSGDGVTKQETVLNNTTGKVDLPHTEGYVTTDNTGMRLWYDVYGDIKRPKVLLIHGNECQAVSWMPHFYEPLVNAGYCVVRFDQRDNGLSENFGKPKGFQPGKWTPEQSPPYPLSDMAADAIGLLEKLNIEAAHVVGQSMGGMIAQLVAISRPDLVQTLVLLATSPSHTFDKTYQPLEVLDFFQRDIAERVKRMALPGLLMPLTRKKMMVLTSEFFAVMDESMSTPHGQDMLQRYMDAYYSNGRKFNIKSWQGMAVVTSKSRAAELEKLNIPTLVVHGSDDKVIDHANGEALAAIIPDAKLITIQGGGHMFAQLAVYSDDYIDDMIDHFQK
jgi:pimeloyl-ACP methyl ester carboxylesterase